MDGGWTLGSLCMAPAETSAGFLRIAHRDLRTAKAMVDSSLFEENTWGFYLQQAIEKALKAWLLVLTPELLPDACCTSSWRAGDRRRHARR